MSKNNANFFWTSYSDLMTSLFFVMLLLFIITVGALQKKTNEVKKEAQTSKQKLEKIEEMDNAIKSIDSNYFEYNDKYKKHILKIKVNFPAKSSNINSIDEHTRVELVKAGESIKNFVEKNKKAKYVLIIEGQASKDNYIANYQLSYERALALNQYWKNHGISFNSNDCEVIVAGSGIHGVPRDTSNETNNQRFMITIMYKSGIIEKQNSY